MDKQDRHLASPKYEPADPPIPEAATPEHVVEVALKAFAHRSYSTAKLEQIARDSGMSKRMIHYYFGDKRGLYKMVVEEAIRRLYPDPQLLELDSAIPVEGVRKIVETLYRSFIAQPDSVAMIQMENVQKILDVEESSPLFDQSRVILPLERLLLLGQDAGAFRPGISAFDVFYLITAMCFRQSSQTDLVQNIFGVDTSSPENVRGIERMTVDATLAFLTSNLASTGQESYLEAMPPVAEVGSDHNQAIYAETHDLSPDLGLSIYGD